MINPIFQLVQENQKLTAYIQSSNHMVKIATLEKEVKMLRQLMTNVNENHPPEPEDSMIFLTRSPVTPTKQHQ
jgi:hypothetical protein